MKWSFNTVKDGDLWGRPEVNSGGGAWYPSAIETATGIVLGTTGESTVTTGIYRSMGVYQQDWGAIYANIVMASAPMVAVYFAMQRFIVGGPTGGAVKG